MTVIDNASEWKPVTDLKQINQDISGFGYDREYIEKYKPDYRIISMTSGRANLYESIEVAVKNNQVLYRTNVAHRRIPSAFDTQFGPLMNHNHGEFASWIEKRTGDGKEEVYIAGNFCDVFDYGNYVYAISNLMHMFAGDFEIVRIDKDYNTTSLFDSEARQMIKEALTMLPEFPSFDALTHFIEARLEYQGRFESAHGIVIAASGYKASIVDRADKWQPLTLLFQLTLNGSLGIPKEFPFMISSSNSIAGLDDFVYYGQNKQITRLDTLSGEISYFTNRSDEELEALGPLR